MSLHRGRLKTLAPSTSPRHGDLLHALRSNQREADENLIDELVCKAPTPYTSLIHTSKFGGRRPDPSPYLSSPVPVVSLSRLTSPKAEKEQTKENDPVACDSPQTTVMRSARLIGAQQNLCPEEENKPMNTRSRFPPCFTSPAHTRPEPVPTPHASLIRTTRFGGRRPTTSPSLVSPAPVVSLSRIDSPFVHEEQVVEIVSVPPKQRRLSSRKKVSFRF
ncbi:unnamed protein product [Echinostoma caproni]|uniref:Uncharacterized protein n=1 Tax=Echinostoma caproni TaxID=27848 RepID=A0A183AT79_9TREM|nr:unnamed protein product [Echinostoma caproni]